MTKLRPCKRCGELPRMLIAFPNVHYFSCPNNCWQGDTATNNKNEAVKVWNRIFGKPIDNREWLESLSNKDFVKFIQPYVCTSLLGPCPTNEKGKKLACWKCMDKWLKAEHVAPSC